MAFTFLLSAAVASVAIHSSTAIEQKPFVLKRKYSNAIDGEYLIFFDSDCLAKESKKNTDVQQHFLDLFECYPLNTKKIDLFPDIDDHWIVVNHQSNCNLNDDTNIDFLDYCIDSVEQNRRSKVLDSSYKSSECTCSSRSVEDRLYNLDSLTPQITDGFEFVQCESDYDPGFDLIIMDTGINNKHPEFQGIRYERIYDADEGNAISRHGTHVAGTFCGLTYGAFRAKNTKVKLVDVRAVDSDNHIDKCAYINSYGAIIHYLRDKKRKAIINISLGDVKGEDLDLSFNKHIKFLKMIRESGGIVITSAGNDNTDACNQQPAASRDTIAVGNVDADFNKAPKSNYGRCVDIWAPGDKIWSANVAGGAIVLSGTSMSSPLVAGVAANILMTNPQFDFQDIMDTLLDGGVDLDFVADQPRVQGTCDIYGVSATKPHMRKQKKKKKYAALSHMNLNDDHDIYDSTNSDGRFEMEYVVNLSATSMRNLWIVAGFVLLVNIVLCGLYYQQHNGLSIK
eukprot:193430_1